MRITFVQTGDFAEAFHKFAAGEAEAYRDQKASVDFVAGLARNHVVSILCAGKQTYQETLAPNLTAIGCARSDIASGPASTVLKDLAPDRLILRSPFLPIAQEAKTLGIATLPSFADLFQKSGPRGWIRHKRLARALSGSNVPCVANHSLNASLSTADILGMPVNKVVPWDWGRLVVDPIAKPGPTSPSAPSLFYAGVLSVEKGVGDCIAALRKLHNRGIRAQISFAGKGDIDRWQAEVAAANLDDAVRFLGLLPNTEVREHMASHDFVVVPSRPSYPEGLPNTIYEALASRSPLILSDHPAFSGRIMPGHGAVIFRAGDPADLADKVATISHSADMYAALSQAAPATLEALYIGLEWTELVKLFINDPTDSAGWVGKNSMSAITSPTLG